MALVNVWKTTLALTVVSMPAHAMTFVTDVVALRQVIVTLAVPIQQTTTERVNVLKTITTRIVEPISDHVAQNALIHALDRWTQTATRALRTLSLSMDDVYAKLDGSVMTVVRLKNATPYA